MPASIYAENAFNKLIDRPPNYSLYYFEIKYKIEEEKNLDNYRRIHIGLKNSENNYVELDITGKTIRFNFQKQAGLDGYIILDKIVWMNRDIIGCGLVYPASTDSNPYVFFTRNGKQIG